MERFEDALTMIDQGDTPGATELLARLVVRTPAHATVHVLLAQAFERQHRWAEALAAWQTAHLLLPDAPLVQQGSLRAARVLAALRTMTAPPPAPPVAPVPAEPAPEPAPDETPVEPEAAAVEPEAAWDPAPAFDAYTDAPDVPDPYLGGPLIEAEAVWEEAWPETAEEAGFEGAADPGTPDADAVGDDAGPGAPTETSELPDVSRPWPGMAESLADAADAPADALPESPDALLGDASLGDDPDVFFDPPATETAEPPPVEAFPAPLEPAERDAPGAADVEAPPATSGIVLPGSVLSALPQTPPVTPPGAVDETVTGPYEPFDLDDLIASLSGAGRIVPSETPPPPPPELDEDALLDDMVSPTLARIHAAQGQYEEAARIYERLAEQEPQRAAEYHAEAAALRQKTSGGA